MNLPFSSFEIKEQAEWFYVIYLNGKEWSRHPTRLMAEEALANLTSNKDWVTRAEALTQQQQEGK